MAFQRVPLLRQKQCVNNPAALLALRQAVPHAALGARSVSSRCIPPVLRSIPPAAYAAGSGCVCRVSRLRQKQCVNNPAALLALRQAVAHAAPGAGSVSSRCIPRVLRSIPPAAYAAGSGCVCRVPWLRQKQCVNNPAALLALRQAVPHAAPGAGSVSSRCIPPVLRSIPPAAYAAGSGCVCRVSRLRQKQWVSNPAALLALRQTVAHCAGNRQTLPR